MSRSTISSWCSGRRTGPNSAECRRLGDILEVRADWLALVGDEMVGRSIATGGASEPVSGYGESGGLLIPRLRLVAAGKPIFSAPGETGDIVLDRRTIERLVGPIPEHAPLERAVFSFEVKGDSMAPLIQDGDVLIVRRGLSRFDPESPRPSEAVLEDEGLYVIADPNNNFETACVKRLVLKAKERRLLVLSDNKRYKAFALDLTSADFGTARFRRWQDLVLGVPVKLIRDL